MHWWIHRISWQKRTQPWINFLSYVISRRRKVLTWDKITGMAKCCEKIYWCDCGHYLIWNIKGGKRYAFLVCYDWQNNRCWRYCTAECLPTICLQGTEPGFSKKRHGWLCQSWRWWCKRSFNGIDAGLLSIGVTEEIKKQKLIACNFDGASVHMGKDNGVAKKLTDRVGDHMVKVHYVAHNLELAVLDIWLKNRMF